MSNGGLALIRLAAALLVLVVAWSALALPVEYAFTATGTNATTATGSLTYDAETDAAVLTSFVAPIEGLAPFDWIGADLWPGASDKFPVDSLGLTLYHRAGSLEGLQVSAVVDVVLSLGVYQNGCAAGTPLADCPPSSFQYHDQGGVGYSLQMVPEPTVLGALVAAAIVAVTTKRRARRYGQVPCVPAAHGRGQLGHFGPDGGA